MQAHGRPDELYFLENVLYENQKLEFSDEDYFEMKNYVEEYLTTMEMFMQIILITYAIRWGISPPWI